jgi:hypothetical protein
MYMADLTLHAFKASNAMEPVALLDYYVRVIANTGTYYRKVSYYEAIPPFQAIDTQAATPRGPLVAAAPLAAGAQGNKSPVNNLGLWKNEFGQWRWFPLDNAQIRLYLPAGNAKWSLKNLQIGLDRSIIYRDPTLLSTEFFTWEEEYPAFEPLNFSAYALPACRIIVFGYRFHTDEIKEGSIGQDGVNAPVGTLAQLKNGALPCVPIFCKAQAGSGN